MQEQRGGWIGAAVVGLGLAVALGGLAGGSGPAAADAAATAATAYLPVVFDGVGLPGRPPRDEAGIMRTDHGFSGLYFDVDVDERHGDVLAVGTALTSVDLRSREARSMWLPEGGVFDAAIDSEGTYWLATESGLVRLDRQGRKRLFGPADGVPMRGRLLAIDAQDGLWLATAGEGEVYHRPRDGAWRRLGALQYYRPYEELRRMAVDSKGHLWVATSVGLHELQPSGAWRVFGRGSLPSSYVTALTVDAQDRVWVGTTSGGVAMYDGGRWRTLEGPLRGPTDSFSDITALAVDREGTLWLTGPLFDLWRRTADDQWSAVPEVTLLPRDFAIDDQGALWSGGLGLSRIGRDGGQEDFPSGGTGNASGLWEALAAPEGGAWFVDGPSLSLLFRSEDGAWRREEPFPEEDNGGVFSRDRLDGLAYDARGRLWVGSTYGAAYRALDGTWQRVGKDDGQLREPVNDIAAATDGAMWFATARGARRLDAAGGWSTLAQADGLVTDTVTTVVAGAEGAVWLGTELGVGRAEAGGAVRWWSEADGLPADEILDLAVHPDGFVYAATAAGVATLTSRDTWRALAMDDPRFVEGEVEQIRFGEDGMMWLGMADARIVHGRPQGPWTVLRRSDGLASGSFNALAPAPDGGAWVAMSLGLSRWHPDADASDACDADLPPLRSAQTLDATLSADGDIDLYRLDIDEPSRVQIVLRDPGPRFELALREACEDSAAVGNARYEDGLHVLSLSTETPARSFVLSVQARPGMLREAARYRLNLNVLVAETASGVAEVLAGQPKLPGRDRLARLGAPR